jgi:hypothetical protein
MPVTISKKSTTGRRPKVSKAVAAPNEDERLPGGPRPARILLHHPDNWEFSKTPEHPEGEILPRTKPLIINGGCHGIRQAGKAINANAALSAFADKGFVRIPEMSPIKFTDPETGEIEDGEGYLLSEEGTRGVIFYERWAQPRVVQRGRKRTVDFDSNYDKAGYRATLRAWVKAGIIAAPAPHVLAKIRSDLNNKVVRNAHQASHSNGAIQEKYAAQVAHLAKLDELIEGTKPKRRRSRGKATKPKTDAVVTDV